MKIDPVLASFNGAHYLFNDKPAQNALHSDWERFIIETHTLLEPLKPQVHTYYTWYRTQDQDFWKQLNIIRDQLKKYSIYLSDLKDIDLYPAKFAELKESIEG